VFFDLGLGELLSSWAYIDADAGHVPQGSALSGAVGITCVDVWNTEMALDVLDSM
jgi:hypothetical protein